MSEMIQFDATGNTKLVAPSYFGDLFGEQQNIVSGGNKTPQLSIKGKMFRITIDGEENLLTKVNKETGDAEPISSIKVIILNQGDRGARAYYEGAYDSGKATAPDCFSLDGKTPDAQSTSPQASSCAACPHAVKGSKVTPTGHATTACALQRRLAVIPANDTGFTPLLLRLASTSAWDKEDKGGNQAKGWFAWQQYMDFLTARGVRHTAQVVTMVKFDTTEYPKLLFRADRFLTEAEAIAVAPKINSEDVMMLLTSVGQDSGSTPENVITPAPKAAASFVAEPAEEVAEEAPPQPVVPPKAAAKPKAPAKVAAEPKQPEQPTQQSETIVDDILSAWDD